jgi:hypothetical protein
LRRSLVDWLTDMHLVHAGSSLDRYIGYYEPYATSHAALDRDTAVQEETRNCARALIAAVKKARAEPDTHCDELPDPRPK